MGALLGLGFWAATPMLAPAQTGLGHLLQHMNPLLGHSSPGYLGVLVGDVDNESAGKLKLKETRGAVITLIDHDAPAGSTLRINDVILSVNGQNTDNTEQFTRLMHEIPAGRKVTLVVSRDGAQQSITVQLCDRKAMEHDVWNKMNSGDAFTPPPPGMSILAGTGDASMPGFHMPLFAGSLNVGAMVEPLTSQMADYLGVPSGVMVKQVARKSEAAAAGLKAFDVVVKVGSEAVKTTADWDRALRANKGKSVQVTILRDRKQQVINLQVDSKRRSEVKWDELIPEGQYTELAQLDPIAGPAVREQMQQQMEELNKQMEQFRQSFNAEDFKIDAKQMQEMQQQMDEFRKSLPQNLQLNREQLEQLKKQLEQMRLSRAGQTA